MLVDKLSCPTFFVVVYVCKRPEVISIVVIVGQDQVRSGRGERPWMQALLSRRPWRLHASPHGRFSRAARSRRGFLSGLPSFLSGIIGNLTDLKKSKPAFLLSAAGLPFPLSAPSVEQQMRMLLGTGRSCPGVGGGCICCPTGGRLGDGPAMRPFSVPRAR